MADTNFVDATANVPGTVIVSSWLDDVNTNTYTILASVAGTNAITATGASTVLVGYPRGVAFRFLPVATNTGAVTINISGLGIKSMTKYGTVPLVAGDLVVGSWAYFAYDGVQFQLLNPLSVATNVIGRLLATQTFTVNGTYTPTPGTRYIEIEGCGGGGAGGGVPVAGGVFASAAGGAAAAAYGRRYVTTPVAQAVTIGAGGIPVAGGVGGAGGTSTFGAYMTLAGGAGGGSGTPGVSGISGGGAAAGTAPVGVDFAMRGVGGSPGITISTTASFSGDGGDGPLGSGGSPSWANGISVVAGVAAGGFGAGGGGAAAAQNGVSSAGGAGSPGIFIVHEYS